MNILLQHRCLQQQQLLQRLHVFSFAIASRIILLFFMSLSCAIIPDFHPGDDVLQFNLRLENNKNMSNTVAASDTCFCLRGHACDSSVSTRRQRTGVNSEACADTNDGKQIIMIGTKQRFHWLDQIYSFILPPITKWDAARFLTLSVDPWARYPPLSEQATCNDVDDDDNTSICNNMTNYDDVNEYYNSELNKSEQAHAFLPMFPITIRYVTNFIIQIIPRCLLPPTYEASVALTAIIVNILSFAIAAVSIYDMTIFILMRDALIESNEANYGSANYCGIAKTTAQLFCINPGGVFFTSAYSESMFAMLTFVGHAIAAKGQYHIMTSSLMNKIADSKSNSRLASYYWIPTTLLWMLASYVRSNGTFSAIWWIIIGIGRCCSYIYAAFVLTRRSRRVVIMTVAKCLSILFGHCILALAVAAPVLYHDWRGRSFHCMQQQSGVFLIQPEWCTQDGDVNFSLYSYVQRKHWNVGLLRYYEIKQMPNFILAMPVLTLSFSATASWIAMSWSRHITCVRSERKHCITLKNVCLWVFCALRSLSSSDLIDTEQQKGRRPSVPTRLVLGASCLSYYAILTGFALVGAFVAHVQISTRLICSSCPVLYFFVSSLVIPCETKAAQTHCYLQRPVMIFFYFILYNLLGVIMHVNWLPWT